MQMKWMNYASASLSGAEVACKQLVDEILINASVQFMFHAIYFYSHIYLFFTLAGQIIPKKQFNDHT